MTTRLPPHVSFGQISGDHRSGELHSISCSVQDGTETTEIMFMDVADITMPLQLPVARDKLRRLAEALLKAADLPHGVSVDLLPIDADT